MSLVIPRCLCEHKTDPHRKPRSSFASTEGVLRRGEQEALWPRTNKPGNQAVNAPAKNKSCYSFSFERAAQCFQTKRECVHVCVRKNKHLCAMDAKLNHCFQAGRAIEEPQSRSQRFPQVTSSKPLSQGSRLIMGIALWVFRQWTLCTIWRTWSLGSISRMEGLFYLMASLDKCIDDAWIYLTLIWGHNLKIKNISSPSEHHYIIFSQQHALISLRQTANENYSWFSPERTFPRPVLPLGLCHQVDLR